MPAKKAAPRKAPRKTTEWLDADAATRLLDVSRATLYAYVSRGFVRSEPAAGRPRERRYAREDVERLRTRAEERRNPEKAAAHALRWGVPILESSITLIADGKLYYRGQDAGELARTRSLEEVAALIWCGSFDADVFDTPLHVVSGLAADPGPAVHQSRAVRPGAGGGARFAGVRSPAAQRGPDRLAHREPAHQRGRRVAGPRGHGGGHAGPRMGAAGEGRARR